MSESIPEGRSEAVVEGLSEDISQVQEPDLPIQTENKFVQLCHICSILISREASTRI